MPRVVVPITIRVLVVEAQTKDYCRCRQQWSARGALHYGRSPAAVVLSAAARGVSFSSSSSVLLQVGSKPHNNNNNKNKVYYYYYIAAAAAAVTGSLAVGVYTRNWRETKIARELPLFQLQCSNSNNNNQHKDELRITDAIQNTDNDCNSSTVRLGRDLTELRHVVQRAGLMGQMHKSVKAELEDIRKWHVSYSLSCYCTALQTTS